MLDIKVIATGSSGNCTLIKSSTGRKILIDVGVPYKKICEEAGYVDYAIITHEHCDHAHKPAIKKLLENGTDVYMTRGTRDALKLTNRHNLHTFTADLLMPALRLGSCRLKALRAKHDAAEPIVIQLYDGEDRILYATDMREPPNWTGEDNAFTKIMIEANYSEPVLMGSNLEGWRKTRVYENHCSIERVIEFQNREQYEGLKEVHLMHISKQNGDAEQFKTMLERVIDKPIYAY